MAQNTFQQTVDRVLEKDARYAAAAYVFVRMALDYTVKKFCEGRGGEKKVRHVSAKEFLEGIRLFALESFGPMASTVFEEWGVKKTDDFGNIVFNLIDAGDLRRTEDDKLEDFHNVYNFKRVFDDPYMP